MQPLFDPSIPDALVMPRPHALHQVSHSTYAICISEKLSINLSFCIGVVLCDKCKENKLYLL